MYNTPNCWAIYCCGKVFKYLKSIGGLEEMHKRNLDKAKVLYDFLDSSRMFNGTVEPQVRSLMNVPFVTESKELDAEGRESIEKLVEKLEEDDDVVNVYHNMKEADEE